MNAKDRKRLALFTKFLPAGLDWKPNRVMQWFASHQHDLKNIPEKMIVGGNGDKVKAYLNATFVKKAKAPAKPKEPAKPKDPPKPKAPAAGK